MDFDQFLGQVQNRARLASSGEALRTARAVLTTLGERLPEGEATDLAGPLPMEIDRFLTEEPESHAQRFGFDEFVARVVERERMSEDDRADAAYHAQLVVDVVSDVAPPGEMEDVRASLPEEYDRLFELAEADEDAG
ncbi:DUF2267 domain-containing protein [Halegenticoccus tardaugens]|uniref:DUF2267 domain-containing protein n=1 Tax=Halegenticoccus tardaugens TaxID=2071624 RepID=UPI00100B234E|nr:DUF2267 domain-containing protein [Halegenticoccus tardaugens]